MDQLSAIIHIFFIILIGSLTIGIFSADTEIDTSNDWRDHQGPKGIHGAIMANNSQSVPGRRLHSRNLGFQEPYFCGQIIGGHFMFGSQSSYCGGYSVRDCSALCFYRNFTYFQNEGFVCHCFSGNLTS